MPEDTNEEELDIKKLATATIVGIVILGAVVYGAYSYSQRKSGNIALPGGTTYLGSDQSQQPPTAPLRFTADPNVSWATFTGKLFPYSFSYPSTLPLVIFPGDGSDPVGIVWGNIPPQQNLLLNIEDVKARDAKYVSQPKIDYVNQWYKYFPGGLKDVKSATEFTNVKGLKGYKAVYINDVGASPNVDVFLEVPGRNDILIHLANGVLDPAIFDKIVDSLDWNAPAPIPTKAQTQEETSPNPTQTPAQ